MNIQCFRKTKICLFTAFLIIGTAAFAAALNPNVQSKPLGNSETLSQVADTNAVGRLSIITELTALEEGDGMSIEVHGSDTLQYTAFKLLNPLRLVLDFTGMRQGTMTERIEVHQGTVSYIQPVYFPEAEVLRVEIVLSAAAAYDIQKPANNQLAIKFNPAEDSTAERSGKEKIQIGLDPSLVDSCAKQLNGEKERISLDFQNVNIKDIFRIIADISGYNIVLAPGVKGSANIRLMDVPWNVGLEIIIKNNQLGRECDGNTAARTARRQTCLHRITTTLFACVCEI